MFSYKAAFTRQIHTIDELTKDIPSKVIIYYLSMINSRIQRDLDHEVFKFATRRWPQNKIEYILNAKEKYEKENRARVVFFSEWIVTEYIKYELINYRDFEYGNPDTTIEHEINLYLAYLQIVDLVLGREEINYPHNDFNFQELIWPLGIFQFEFVNYTHPIFGAIRIEVFLWNLKQQDKYSTYIEKYIERFNVKTTWELISLYVNIMKWIVEKKEQKGEFFFLTLQPGDKHTELFESLVINITEYQESAEKQKYFIGLKEKPLFKYDKDIYLILNSKFLLNQIYNGVLMNFFKTSGISEVFGGSFANFKSTQSFLISEKILFRKGISLLFDNKKFQKFFPENDNIVDGYVRQGKYIYLFEFKDASVALSLVDSRNYQEFEGNLRRNFIENEKGRPKGAYQLLNTIRQIIKSPLDFDNFNKKRIKTRNIIMYPIIIYTDHYYSMFGVNEYLERKFKQAIDFDEIGTIKPLTMMSLDFLLQHGEAVAKGEMKDIIDAYHNWRKRIDKKMRKNPDPNESFKIYSSIEHSPQSQLKDHENGYSAKVVHTFLDHLPKE